MARTYLDWNATAPLRPEAKAAIGAAMERLGNPSSVHSEGRQARGLIEDGRRKVAALVGADPRDVVFTSGGTEANMQALTPRLEADKPCGRLLVSAVEHPSVLAAGRFAAEVVEQVPVSRDGIVVLADLERRLDALARGGVRPLVSVMLANNESGVVQPIAAIAEAVHAADGLLHVDAVQGPGKLALDIHALGADLMTLSAHKLGGPSGVGALVRRSDSLQPELLIKGGGQERGLRAGTENVLGIVGFGAAAAAVQENFAAERSHMMGLRDRLEAGVRAISPEIIIFGDKAERLPNTTLFAHPGGKAETLVIGFDLEGIALSSGAACSSGKVAVSHVLQAMGVERELARGAIRVSLGRTTSEDDVERFLNAWKKLVSGLSQRQEIRAA